jgi:hypothetical protein
VGSCEYDKKPQSGSHSEPLERTSEPFIHNGVNGKPATTGHREGSSCNTESNGHSQPSYITRGHRTILELVELGLINKFDSHAQEEARHAGGCNTEDAKNRTSYTKSTNNCQSSSAGDCDVWDSLIHQVDKSWVDDELGMRIRCSVSHDPSDAPPLHLSHLIQTRVHFHVIYMSLHTLRRSRIFERRSCR